MYKEKNVFLKQGDKPGVKSRVRDKSGVQIRGAAKSDFKF